MNFANCRARQAAFTLMEVMITIAIVGILAAIALPQYNVQVTRSRIIDGTVKLGDFRAQLDKYFLDNRTYQRVPPAGTACGVTPPPAGGGDAFQIACDAPTATTYLIRVDGLAAKNMALFQYTVDQTGFKTTTSVPVAAGWNYPAPTNDCWAIKKDGSCQ